MPTATVLKRHNISGMRWPIVFKIGWWPRSGLEKNYIMASTRLEPLTSWRWVFSLTNLENLILFQVGPDIRHEPFVLYSEWQITWPHFLPEKMWSCDLWLLFTLLSIGISYCIYSHMGPSIPNDRWVEAWFKVSFDDSTWNLKRW